MMRPLRKGHLFIWSLLGLLIPAGIIVAWLSVPDPLSQTLLQPATTSPLPIVIKTTQTQNYEVSIRGNADGSRLQLEWINKKALEYPTATIYAGKEINDLKNAKLIGRIETRGNWYFLLDSTFKNGSGNTDHFILYDFIHQQVIDTINFKP